MASSRLPPPSKQPLDLDLTIVSAKHLKNVNWRNFGDLKPYAVFWVDPDRRLATKSDESGSTRPVWNERFTLPLTASLHDSFLTLEIFHSKPSDTTKPLVGTLRIALKDVPDLDDPTRLRTFTLVRPSGRPQGKIRIKLSLRERPLPPDYHIAPPPSYFYSTAPPRDYRGYSSSPYTSALPPASPAASPSPPPPPPSSYHYSSYPDAYAGYYPGYYSSAPPPPLPPRPFFDRPVSYGGPSGPSAPVDYTPYDQKPKSGKMGLGTGLAVGAAAGALGGLALDEGLKYEEEKIADRVESDLAAREDYGSEYHRSDY